MKYVKKPVEIEAVQWNGKNLEEILGFTNHIARTADQGIEIPTPAGTMTANEGDYIIKGVKGEFYPCKPDVFYATYAKVEDDGVDTTSVRQYINSSKASERRLICNKKVKAAIISQNGITRLFIDNKEIQNVHELNFYHDAERVNHPVLSYMATVENVFND